MTTNKNYSTVFRDDVLVKKTLEHIVPLADLIARRLGRALQIMEVCGGHTHTIFRYGLHELIPSSIEFVHGPGCPVCVLPKSRVDVALDLANQPDVILTTFGDTMRVPGSRINLLQAKAQGCDVRVVYSPLDALKIARANPMKHVVFFAIGFETTTPPTAFTIQQAARERLQNFSVLCNHITIMPTLRTLLDDKTLLLDGLIGPGHVSTIIGSNAYSELVKTYTIPLVISGFEPLDVLQSLHMLLKQLDAGKARVENQYARGVNAEGNVRALRAIEDVFELRERFAWRGLGEIEHSGVQIREKYRQYDAERRFDLNESMSPPEASLPCGDVLKGKMKPVQCKYFGNECKPAYPMGALMVSTEGACAAYYQYAKNSIKETIPQ